MTVQYSVAVCAADRSSDHQRVILATLPNRFRVIDGDNADVLLVSPMSELAGQLEMMGRDTRAVFVNSPGRLSAGALETLRQRAAGRPVIFGLVSAMAFGETMQSQLRLDAAEAAAIVDAAAEVSSTDAGELRECAFEHLMLLDSIVGKITRVTMLVDTDRHWIAAIETESGTPGIRVSVRRSFRTRLSLHTVSRTRRRQLILVPEPHASPAELTVFDDKGSHASFPVFQGGQRQSWLELHAGLAGGREWESRLRAVGRVLSVL